jgi:hypothetical protein
VATESKQQELRERAAEFTAARDALARAAVYPVVMASPVEQKRLAALNSRAVKIQALIENVGKMIDGARHWFADTFSMDIADEVPVANTVIDTAMQSAIAAMNYFIRDTKKELDIILKAQQTLDAAPEDQQKKMLAELSTQQPPGAAVPISKRTGAMILAAIGLLLFLAKGAEHGEAEE